MVAASLDEAPPARALTRVGAWVEAWRGLARAARLDSCIVPPVFIALGILLYLRAPWAAPPALLLALCALGLAGRWAAARWIWASAPRWAAAMLAWAALGYGAAGLRTWSVDTPIAPDLSRSWAVEGWVSRLDGGDRVAVTIEVARIEGMAPEATPAKVRVRVTGAAPSLGAGVRVRAGLSPPPGPSAAAGYDYSRQAYFDRIGATGFSYGPAEPLDVRAALADRPARALARLRGALTDHIVAQAPGRAGGVLAALVTGVRSHVREADNEALRDSGLAHLLSISGAHMSLVGGGAFVLSAALLALIAPLSRSWDVRKPAAAIALTASTIYLMLSGGDVTALRAWIMLTVMLVAVLFDRRALTLRNVAVAAVLVMLIAPESLFEAGFQMSFAATLSLIAAYDWLRGRRIPGRERSLWASGLRFFGALLMTSLVAGLATAFFAAFHFHRTAPHSLTGNMLGMPLFTFVVMPLLSLATLLAPLGLDGPVWRLAALGMEWVLRIGEWVAALPGAMVPTPAGAPAALGVYALGFVVLCAGRGAARAGGAGMMALSLALWAATPRPILWVSDSAVAAGMENGVLYASDRRRSAYGVGQFAQRIGLGAGAQARSFSDIARCDSLGCVGPMAGLRVAAAKSRAALAEDCADADLVVFREPVTEARRQSCAALLLDGGLLGARGAATIYRGQDGALRARHAGETAWRPPYRPAYRQ